MNFTQGKALRAPTVKEKYTKTAIFIPDEAAHGMSSSAEIDT